VPGQSLALTGRVIAFGFLEVLGAFEQDVDVSPQRAAILAFGRGQFAQRVLIAQPGQVGVGPPVRQRSLHQDAICRLTAVQLLGPGGQFGLQPLASKLGSSASAPLRISGPGPRRLDRGGGGPMVRRDRGSAADRAPERRYVVGVRP